MPKFDRETAVLCSNDTGREILPGEKVVAFRGETYRFDYISKLPGGNSMGKVVASQQCKHGSEGGHFTWCESGWSQRELFPSVLHGRILVLGEPK